MNAIKRKVKDFVLSLLKEDEVYYPKKQTNPKVVRFETKSPLGNGKYVIYTFTCMEWGNGEGFDINIESFNEFSHNNTTTNISLCNDETNGIMACLNEFNVFDCE